MCDGSGVTTSESQLGLDLTHSCVAVGNTQDTAAADRACDVWTGRREHPSAFLPLGQSCARRVLGSEGDPLLPTFMRHVAFFKHVEQLKHSDFQVFCARVPCFWLQIQTQVFFILNP